jgi:hypothetical protein
MDGRQIDAMIGYTSAGIGTSGLPVRLSCPAEATVFALRCAISAPAREPQIAAGHG